MSGIRAVPYVLGLALGTLTVSACGLSTNGIGELSSDASSSDDGSVASGDSSFHEGDGGAGDATVRGDSAPAQSDSGEQDVLQDTFVVDAPPPSNDGGPCPGTASNCGTPGNCVNCGNSPRGDQCLGTACGCKMAPDCTASGVGKACLGSGVCGCMMANDCPMGQACDTNTNSCTTSCSATQLCNGGCCNAGTCNSGVTATSCVGGPSGSCTECTEGTPTCHPGGCTNACGRLGDGTCGTGFCCDFLMGQCAPDNTPKTCGASGQFCVDCTTPQNGMAGTGCLSSGRCGCATNMDCMGAADGKSCNTTEGTCGCTTSTASTDCAGSPYGSACLSSNICGCMTENDCPMNQACNGGRCSTTCSASSSCHGGCCQGVGLGRYQCVGACQMGMCKSDGLCP